MRSSLEEKPFQARKGIKLREITLWNNHSSHGLTDGSPFIKMTDPIPVIRMEKMQ
ncbi:hypothetical protein QNI22_34225 [Cytophagaceae bacterium BD1B2-1]|uniref:Uncharacterized protein n=1 Tax=Xanthocytophaga agilis TaxID=3048010 RepID=A0AAE3RCE1_9BACT|nr:hypothetical protein [Xanthocytophaga agilis]